MRSFRQFITELLDKPLPWKWVRQDPRTVWTARFTTPKGFIYDVDFDYFTDPQDQRSIELVFSINERLTPTEVWVELGFDTPESIHKAMAKPCGITKTGDELFVFATVVQIVKDFFTQDVPKWHYLSFSAAEPSRKRLYDRFAQMIERSLPTGYEINTTEDDRSPERYYRICKKDGPDF